MVWRLWKWTTCEMKWCVLGMKRQFVYVHSDDDAPGLHSVSGGDKLTTIVSVKDALGGLNFVGLQLVKRSWGAHRSRSCDAVQPKQKGQARNSIAWAVTFTALTFDTTQRSNLSIASQHNFNFQSSMHLRLLISIGCDGG